MAVVEPTIDVHLAVDDWIETIAEAARRSLVSEPPYVDPLWFYDEQGSKLFDAITRLPEYYLTRAEQALLRSHASEIAAERADVLIELGSGTSDKTTVLLDAMVATGSLETYVAFDVSENTLRHAVAQLAAAYRGIAVHGVVGDFHNHLGEVPSGKRSLIALLGSTIGNLDPNERRRFLTTLRLEFGPEDCFLLGIDLIKAPERLIAAYDDAAGVTAEFNRNALRVLNHEIGSDFVPESFDHVALWDASENRIEMRLRARSDQHVNVPGISHPVVFQEGDELRTEISTKFAVEAVTEELSGCGFALERVWIAPGDEFALLLARSGD